MFASSRSSALGGSVQNCPESRLPQLIPRHPASLDTWTKRLHRHQLGKETGFNWPEHLSTSCLLPIRSPSRLRATEGGAWLSGKRWKLGVEGRCVIGGREGSLVGGVAWGQDFDPGSFWASNPQNVVHCVEKAHLVPDSTVLPTRDRTQQTWPSSRLTLRRMTVFLNTTTSSARTFSRTKWLLSLVVVLGLASGSPRFS